MANLPMVWRSLYNKIRVIRTSYDKFITDFLRASNSGQDFPGACLAMVDDNVPKILHQDQSSWTSSEKVKNLLDDIFGPFLRATPKKYRSYWVRQHRKFGMEKWAPHGYKMLRPKDNLVMCSTCGSFHERQYLCDTCYERTREASIPIFEEMAKQLGGKPIDKEIGFIFKGETKTDVDQLIVEVPVERPPLFSKNLLSKTTMDSASPREATPTDHETK